MSQVTSRVRRTTHKHFIEVPTSLEHKTEMDSRNKNTFSQDAIAKDMKIIGVTFDIFSTEQLSPVGNKRTSGHTLEKT